MKVPSRKRIARNPTKVPLWLRRLDRVKAELKATRFTRTADECLRLTGTPYVGIGACALAIWRQPRATADLDLLVLAKEQELDRLGTFMTKAEMEVDETWQQWNPLLRGLQLRFQYRGVTIDL